MSKSANDSKKTGPSARDERLAKALRDNLRRRKAGAKNSKSKPSKA